MKTFTILVVEIVEADTEHPFIQLMLNENVDTMPLLRSGNKTPSSFSDVQIQGHDGMRRL